MAVVTTEALTIPVWVVWFVRVNCRLEGCRLEDQLTEERVDDLQHSQRLGPFGELADAGPDGVGAVGGCEDGGLDEDGSPEKAGDGVVEDEVDRFDGGLGRHVGGY